MTTQFKAGDKVRVISPDLDMEIGDVFEVYLDSVGDPSFRDRSGDSRDVDYHFDSGRLERVEPATPALSPVEQEVVDALIAARVTETALNAAKAAHTASLERRQRAWEKAREEQDARITDALNA